MLGKDYSGQDCALAAALEVIGERWTLLIVRDALFGVRRYSDFVARLDIPRAVLADRLAGLVEAGVLRRQEDCARPGRFSYELTPAGRELWPVVHALMTWGSHHRRRSSMVYCHELCGSELVVGARCPACGVVPPPEDVIRTNRRGRKMLRTDAVSQAMKGTHRLLEPVEPDRDRIPKGAVRTSGAA